MNIIVEKDAERKKNNQIHALKNAQMDFKIIETTNTVEIEFMDRGVNKRYFYLLNQSEHNGAIIRDVCRSVKADVKKYLSRKGNKIPYYDRDDVVTFLMDNKAINAMCVGDVIREIDINKCYWTWAYYLGYISYDTFMKYLDFKEERLIALGNLAKIKDIKVYINGMFKTKDTKQDDFAPFFFSIIAKTYKLYMEINRKVNNKTILFKTDAFFVPPSIHIENKISAELDKHNFSYKSTLYKVDSIAEDSIKLVSKATGKEKIIYTNRTFY